MSVATDPFTAGFQAIIAALRAWAPLTALIGAGGVMDETSAGFEQPAPDVQAGESPCLRLAQGAFSASPARGDSKALEFSQSYELRLFTDSLNPTTLNKVKFHTLRALLAAGSSLALSQVKTYDLADAKDSPAASGSRRYAAVMTINLTFYLPRAQLVDPTAA